MSCRQQSERLAKALESFKTAKPTWEGVPNSTAAASNPALVANGFDSAPIAGTIVCNLSGNPIFAKEGLHKFVTSQLVDLGVTRDFNIPGRSTS